MELGEEKTLRVKNRLCDLEKGTRTKKGPSKLLWGVGKHQPLSSKGEKWEKERDFLQMEGEERLRKGIIRGKFKETR